MDNRSEIVQSASAAIQDSDPEKALRLAREILESDPDNADGYLILGIAHAMLGNNPDAISALRNAVHCAPDSARARYNFATHLYRVGQKGEAAEQVAAALAADPTHSASHQLRRLLESESVVATPAVASEAPPVVVQAPWYESDEQPKTPPPTWLDGLGIAWPIVGWLLTLAGIAVFIITAVLLAPVAMNMSPAEMFSEKYFKAIQRALPSWLEILDWTNRFLWITWIVVDVFGKRRSPWWLLGIVPCCCLNLYWLTGIAYLTTSRVEKK